MHMCMWVHICAQTYVSTHLYIHIHKYVYVMYRNTFIHTCNFLSYRGITFVCIYSLCLLYLFTGMDVIFPHTRCDFNIFYASVNPQPLQWLKLNHSGGFLWHSEDQNMGKLGLCLPLLPAQTHFAATKAEDLRGFFYKCKMNLMLFWPFQRSTEGRAEVGDPLHVTLPQRKLPSCKALQIVIRSYDLSVRARSCGLSEPPSPTQKPSNFHDRDSLQEDGLLWGSQGMPREGGDFPCVLLKL